MQIHVCQWRFNAQSASIFDYFHLSTFSFSSCECLCCLGSDGKQYFRAYILEYETHCIFFPAVTSACMKHHLTHPHTHNKKKDTFSRNRQSVWRRQSRTTCHHLGSLLSSLAQVLCLAVSCRPLHLPVFPILFPRYCKVVFFVLICSHMNGLLCTNTRVLNSVKPPPRLHQCSRHSHCCLVEHLLRLTSWWVTSLKRSPDQK